MGLLNLVTFFICGYLGILTIMNGSVLGGSISIGLSFLNLYLFLVNA